MAEEENDAPALEGGSKKKLIIIVAAVVLLLGSAIVAYFLLAGGNDAEQQKQEVVEERAESKPVSYVAMPRPFVFNVMDGRRDRLVQIKVQLMVRGDSSATLARKHTPLLEGTLVRVFGAATVEQLRTPAGKKQLRDFALKALNEATMKVENKALISAVLFTGFVLQ